MKWGLYWRLVSFASRERNSGFGCLRDNHGRHGEIVRASREETFLDLLFIWVTVVLDVSVFRITVEGVQVEEVRDIRMCRWAVIALVEIIRKNLPVIVPLKLIGMVQVVVVEIQAQSPISFLCVNALKVLFPGNLWDLLCVEVHPNESVHVDPGMNRQEAITLLIKVKALVARCLGELPVQSIRPAVVPTGQDLCISGTLVLDDGIGAVAADVVEGVYTTLAVSNDDDVEAGQFTSEPVARLLETRAMGHEEPPFAEDGAALQLVHLG